ncbi:MAG: hypothetical protein EAZ24_02570 [Burkholderiales bacterium]|nr:MAG: hypothetical protein EAZ21_03540 [Betaproteobacteria bacterium]TAG83796.1 MAG: hypothetical protein EAZ24_02570 [Burkholderiales bacterium]
MSGGSLVAANVLSTLSSRRSALRLVAMNSVADEAILSDYDEVWLTSEIDRSDEFATRFADVVSATKPDLIVPTRDTDVAWLASYQQGAPQQHHKLLCGAVRIANAMLDKLDSAELARELDLPFAETVGCTDHQRLREFAKKHGFPLIAKPRCGFASRGVRVVVRAEQLGWLSGRDDYVVQEYLGNHARVAAHVASEEAEGIALFHSLEEIKISLQANIDSNGNVTSSIATRNTMLLGKSVSVSRETSADTQALTRRSAGAFAVAGWRGPINVQCQRGPDGQLKIFEFNGRFTGATSARRWLGHDEVGDTLRHWLGWQSDGDSSYFAETIFRRSADASVNEEMRSVLNERLHWVRE